MNYTFALIGYGSAALHLLHAALKMKTSVILIPRNSKSYNSLRERYNHRYNQDLPTSVFVASSRDRFIDFKVGLVTTPPFAHTESVKILLSLTKSNSIPTIFVEKPMNVDIYPLPINVLSDSHLNFFDKWNDFLDKVIDMTKNNSIVRIETNFIEDLTAASRAHPWKKKFTKGWLVDEKKGGGVLGEYSHALHWLGNILQKIGNPLPLLKEITTQNIRLNQNNSRMTVLLHGYSSNVECLVNQAMSFQSSSSSKFVRITFQSGLIHIFDFNNTTHLEARTDSRVHLLNWLLNANSESRDFSLIRDRAIWINSIVHRQLDSYDSTNN